MVFSIWPQIQISNQITVHELFYLARESAVVATLVKARDDELESDDRSASSLASSNPGGAAFANCILGVALAKLRKRYFRRLHPRVG